MDVPKIDKTNFPERSGRTSNKLEKKFDPKIMPTNNDDVVVKISKEALKAFFDSHDVLVRPKDSKENFYSVIKKGFSILNWLKNLFGGNISNN